MKMKMRIRKMSKTVSLVVLATMLAVLMAAPVHASVDSGRPGIIPSAAGPLKSSSQIIDDARLLDGKTIVYQGEIIGDIMVRGDHVWINVSDGVNAIGIWLTDEQAKDLTVAGRYNARGDIVRITGQFNRSCPEHGGDYDIHPTAVTIVEAGYPIVHPVNPWLILISVGIFIGAIVVLLLYRQQKHRSAERWSVKMMMPAGSRLRLR